jgi:hypothetical protein
MTKTTIVHSRGLAHGSGRPEGPAGGTAPLPAPPADHRTIASVPPNWGSEVGRGIVDAVRTHVQKYAVNPANQRLDELNARIDSTNARISQLEGRLNEFADSPRLRYLGVHNRVTRYLPGDAVTHQGTLWACLRQQMDPSRAKTPRLGYSWPKIRRPRRSMLWSAA